MTQQSWGRNEMSLGSFSVKRKLEFSDVASVDQPMEPGQRICPWHGQFCHGIRSGVKVSQQGSDYFYAMLSDGKVTINISLSGLRGLSRPKSKRGSSLLFSMTCQIKKAMRGSNMEVILKRTTAN